MLFRCKLWANCPLTVCPHYKPHEHWQTCDVDICRIANMSGCKCALIPDREEIEREIGRLWDCIDRADLTGKNTDDLVAQVVKLREILDAIPH